MNLETFFKKFDQFADAPDVVVKMRELVLELAVRGRLLSSYSPDSSAESDPASPFAIPQDWQWIALNKAADCRAAAKVDAASLNDSDWVLDLEDIDGGAGKVIATATFAERRSLSTKASFQKGDVLYGKLRPYLNKVVIADRPGFCTTEIIPLRPQKYAAAGYLRLFLRSPHFLRYASAKNYGMKMPRLGTQDLESAAISLPPLEEQKRIVAKVDELMALCDRLEAQQQEREEKASQLTRASLARFADAPTPANLHFLFHPSFTIPPADLRKSILTLAVQGDLSAGSSDPTEWSTVTMQEVCDLITDGEHATPQRIPSGVPLATAKNVRDGFLDMDHTDYVAPETAEKCWKRCKPKHGDILMVCVGATTGRVCLVTNPPDMVLVRSVALLRPSTKRIEGTFLDLFLRSPSGQTQIWGGVRQNAQPCLYLGKMSVFTIQLPPLAEQRRIVAKVEQLMALVDALETQLADSRDKGQKLLEAVVGELTLTS